MSEEERKEEQVAPEVEAARKELERYAKVFLEDVTDPNREYADFATKADALWLRTWSGIVLSDDVPEAFWQQVLEDVEYWLKRTKEDIAERKILRAIKYAQLALEVLSRYAELLGLEVPPEEKPEEEEAAEEVEVEVGPVEEPSAPEPVEGTSLTVLFPKLSVRAHNALCRSGALAEAAGIAEGDLRRPYVEEVLSVLETRGEEFFLGWVKHFGKKSLEELKIALQEKGFLPAEEED